jgi:hypothetical protein
LIAAACEKNDDQWWSVGVDWHICLLACQHHDVSIIIIISTSSSAHLFYWPIIVFFIATQQ